MPENPAQAELSEALEREGEGYRLLLAGRREEARAALARASAAYERSWEAAGPRSFGRLVGMLKTAVLAGDATGAAANARAALDDGADSPPSWYALALAALAEGDDDLARRAAAAMGEGGDAFARTADAIAALAGADRPAYERALSAIVADFEAREEHLTGVRIADTAVVLERLAAQRGMAAHPQSELVPDA